MTQLELDFGQKRTKLERLYNDLPQSLRDHLDGFLGTLQPSTAGTYRSTLINFLHANNNSTNSLWLRQYNLDKWNDYVEKTLTGIDQSTIRTKASAVKSFFAYLISKGERKTNPLDGYSFKKVNKDGNNRNELTWQDIQKLKQICDGHKRTIFEEGYYHGASITKLNKNYGYSGNVVNYHMKQLGEQIGIPTLKYSDVLQSRKKYFGVCPVSGKEFELIVENWTFRDGLLQAKNTEEE